MEPEISVSYSEWLDGQKMPAGKRSAMKSALELFAKQGFDGTSTMAIAKNAGISQATIFKYFKTKDDLLQAILEPLLGHLFPNYRDEFLGHFPKLQTLRDEIHYFIRNRFDFVEENSQVTMILISQVMTNKEMLSHFYDLLSASSPQFLTQIYSRLKKTGGLREDASPLVVFRTMVSLVLGYFLQRNLLAPDLTIDEDADLQQIEDIIMRAIGKPGQ
ncbi:TetR/AcrR family transcriptional regulator [Secundilactobacillus folii]|uniref:TetR family transcriptional regulator n=1 Tax=Secundilactobacillus folii TaxID=2678357 RepID=A0A7X3C3Q9_9LACO|nr:TetR/AcrR family transcriptional regulator [Secundilactobacillus folii]MTV82574.1 TetR family transcriptional regulator [Secundilactobacillus folii]